MKASWRSIRLLATTAIVGSVLLASSAQAAIQSSFCTGSSGITCPGGFLTVSGANGRNQHPEIVISFWQDQSSTGYEWETWSSYQNSPTLSALVGGALSITNSPYYAKLNQYGTLANGLITRPRLSPYAPIWTGAPTGSNNQPASFTFGNNQNPGGDIKDVVQSLVNAGELPAPVSGDDTVYVVFLPSTATTTSCGGANGCNTGCTISNLPAECIYVRGNYYQTFVHETAEAISAWNGITISGQGGQQCTFNNGLGAATQISDPCQCQTENQNSFSVQGYWSVQDSACVIPESWGDLYTDSGSGWSSPAGSFYERQMYGGGGGLIATNGVENTNGSGNDVYFYLDGSGWLGHCGVFHFPQGCEVWYADSFGSGGSEFAVGGTGSNAIVAGIPLDTKYGVNTYPIGQGLNKGWTGLGGPNGDPITSVQVTSNGVVVVTDTSAQPWYWTGSAWSNFGGPGDQFLAWGPYIIGLNPGRNDVFQTNPGSGWTQVASGITTPGLIAGVDATENWAYYNPNQASVSGFYDIGNTGDGQNFEFTAYSDYLMELLPTSDDVDYCESSYPCFQDVWYNSSGVGGRLISGKNMYVTGCNSGSAPCANLCWSSGYACTSNGQCCSNDCYNGSCL